MSDLILSWPAAARQWEQAAPVGNGRLGAMVFGGARRARWQINDATVWSGTPHGPSAALAGVLAAGAGPWRLAEVRAAIRAEDHRRAEQLLMSFEGPYSQEYLPFADLWMTLGGDPVFLGRTLNLDNGVVTERIEVDGRTVRRTTWASRPAGALCIAVALEGGGVVDLGLALGSPLRVVHRAGTTLGVEIPVDGAPQHEPDVADPLRYTDGPVEGYDPFGAVALAIDTDGELRVAEDEYAIRGATRVLVTVASSTNGAEFWHGRALPDRGTHLGRAQAAADAALAAGRERLLAEHEADLRGLLGGAEVTVGRRRGGVYDVADEVLSGKDEQLTATVIVQLGRYLLAGASRPGPGGGPPANLQGIWNDRLRPAWSSNYTLNINLQMNYWAAWQAGLGACDEPLLKLVERLAETGAAVADALYGARGWVAHHNSDMWAWALPVGMGHGAPSWAIWMMGGVWLCQHVWEHYDFTQDAEFLRERGWPLLRGSAQFCLDWLVEGEDGLLETIPSTSPENHFVARHGGLEALSVSTAMDMALIRALFMRILAAADILELEDDEICAEIRRALPRLRGPELTADGRLREWSADHPEAYPQHRHLSHLVALHPLDQIDLFATPALAAAAAATLDRRGPGAMGWSWSWKIALRARLGQAAQARSLLREATRPLDGDPAQDAPPDGSQWGGLLPNLFSTHPPFQIDGNFGLMAGVLEMLVQSRGVPGDAGEIRILPALPEQWPDGSCRGIRCRGGLAVDADWSGGALRQLTVQRVAGHDERPIRVRYGERVREIRVPAGGSVRLAGLGLELVAC